jgi:uncharacterized protein DUF1648
MNRRFFQFAIVLLWLTIPVVALPYWSVWGQLPARMATHFNAAGEANGWMSREVALEFGLGIMAFLLAIFTPILWYMTRRTVDLSAWAMFGFCAIVLGFMIAGNQAILNHSLQGTPVRPDTMLIILPVAIVLLIAIFLGAKRDHPLPPSELIAQETHSGRGWSLLLVPALIGPAIAATLVPVTALRISMSIVGLIGIAATAMAWSGFQYRFLRHGVEIRTLGFRLRSIPRQQIQSYAAEPWAMWRGYGIRGVGDCRAYVWGNKVVHIKTSNGEVFLGHSDPDKIVRDLDLVKGSEIATSTGVR